MNARNRPATHLKYYQDAAVSLARETPTVSSFLLFLSTVLMAVVKKTNVARSKACGFPVLFLTKKKVYGNSAFRIRILEQCFPKGVA